MHLEGALVFVGGKVESTGSGQVVPNYPHNHLAGANRPDKPSNSTSGIEIWGDYFTIDSDVSFAELNADTGGSGGSSCSGGTNGRGWIDLYALDRLEIFGGTDCRFAVHANAGQWQDSDDGGIITAKCVGGDMIVSGLAIQADATDSGGKGGRITIEAFTDLFMDRARLSARGDYSIGCGGGYGYGGHIAVRAYNGSLTWTHGNGDVRPTGTAVPTSRRGTIKLTYSVALDTSNTLFPANGTPTTPGAPTQASGGNPDLPFYVVLPHF